MSLKNTSDALVRWFKETSQERDKLRVRQKSDDEWREKYFQLGVATEKILLNRGNVRSKGWRAVTADEIERAAYALGFLDKESS